MPSKYEKWTDDEFKTKCKKKNIVPYAKVIRSEMIISLVDNDHKKQLKKVTSRRSRYYDDDPQGEKEVQQINAEHELRRTHTEIVWDTKIKYHQDMLKKPEQGRVT